MHRNHKEISPQPQLVAREIGRLNRYIQSTKPFFQNIHSKVKTRVMSHYVLLESTLAVIQSLLKKYCQTLQLLKEKFENSKSIMQVNQEISVYSKFKEDLTLQINRSMGEIESIRKDNSEAQNKLCEDRKKLQEINRQNIELTIMLTRNKDLPTSNFKPSPPSKVTPPPHFPQLDQQIQAEQARQKDLRQRLRQKKGRVQTFCEQFELCLESLQKYLISNQKKVRERTLKGTMFFKLLENDILKKSKSYGSLDLSSLSQDLASKNLMFGNLKQKFNRFQKINQQRQEDIQVTWQRFKQFQPLQLIGLMNLQPQSFENLKSQILNRRQCLVQAIKGWMNDLG